VLPLTLVNSADYNRIAQPDELEILDVRQNISQDNRIRVLNKTRKETYDTQHSLSERQIEMILEGGLINAVRKRQHRP
jgi:aconitate hydratase